MSTIGRYPLVRVLGSGAFATVWLARDEELDVDVAIKVLADNWSSDADVRERFLHEARLLRRISDPRVVRVHDVGVHRDQPYFVMDHVPHGSLADAGPGARPPALALWLGAEAAFAVAVLHDAGVLHRDVKPSNLLLADAGPRPRLLVADLGLAKAIVEGSGYTVTAGTPAYTAPEQARGGSLDARTDVYSLAAVTYELLTGRRPYPGGGMLAVAERDPAAAPDPVAVDLGLPASLDALLAAALATDPDRRPASARELGQALLAYASDGTEQTGPGSSARLGPVADSTTAVGSRPPATWPVRTVALLAVLAFVASAVVGYLLVAR